MKIIIFTLLLALTITRLKAQDTTTVKPKYEYAFVYANLSSDSLNIYFDNGKVVNISEISNSNYIKNAFNSYNSITSGFVFYIKAFNYLEERRYELMGTGSYMYFNGSIPCYIYRKKKLE